MKAIQLTTVGKPLEEREVPLPQPAPDDVLVKIKAAGICHSDGHYRAGVSKIANLPVTLGHEMAGVADRVGANVKTIKPGDRVCVHYLIFCGACYHCSHGHEQFCSTTQMLGKSRNGGYAEYALVPERSLFVLPPEIPFEVGAIMMCSSSTSYHALNKARLKPGETVAIFGFGGLGFSALQLAKAMGAGDVYAVDINSAKLKTAESLGAIPIDATKGDPVEQIQNLTKGRGVDVSLELIGLPQTMDAAVRCVGIFGRAALVGLTQKTFDVAPYQNVINKEAEIIGVSDHLASEIPQLLEFARTGKLKFPKGTIKTVPIDADLINQTIDTLDRGSEHIRTVIIP